MKQLLKNFAKSKLIIMAAALVAAIVIAIVSISGVVRKNRIDKQIQTLRDNTEVASEEFRSKYSELPEDTKRELRQNLLELIESLFGKKTSYSFKEYGEIKEILKGYPSLYDDVVNRDDIYSILLASACGGVGKLDEFLADCRLGIPGYMVMAQFTSNLDPIYYYIEYDGLGYHIVMDQTRDDYGDDYGYVEAFGQYLKVERYQTPDGTVGEYGFLTNNVETKYADVIGYFANVNYNPSIEVPDYWQFYMGIITPEQLEDRVLSSDRLSKTFESEYTGYADIHPSFKDENPMTDMDGDGIQDRIYRKYTKSSDSTDESNVYCMFGDGNTITIGKNIWGNRFKTIMCDVTNDGVKDICFIQYSNEAANNKSAIEISVYKDGRYVHEDLPETEAESIDIITDSSGLNAIKMDNYTLTYSDGQWRKNTVNE